MIDKQYNCLFRLCFKAVSPNSGPSVFLQLYNRLFLTTILYQRKPRSKTQHRLCSANLAAYWFAREYFKLCQSLKDLGYISLISFGRIRIYFVSVSPKCPSSLPNCLTVCILGYSVTWRNFCNAISNWLK